MLAEILQNKRQELAALRKRSLPQPPARRPLELRRSKTKKLGLIAEIKHRSPSAGTLSTHLSVEERAAAYQRGGADVLSILCDQKYFGGDYDFLSRARSACSLPLLCKEFIVDEIQLDTARAFGADAVLLIVRCLPQPALIRLVQAATERDLEALVEIHAPEEAARALDAGATWIGVNARDLETLKLDAERAQTVIQALPDSISRAHLSGVHTEEDIRRVSKSSADAALIGETLMRQDNPQDLMHRLIAAAQ